MKINTNQNAITDITQIYNSDNEVVNVLEVNVKGMFYNEAEDYVKSLKETILKEQPKLSLVLIPVCS